MLYSEWVANELSFRHLKPGYESNVAQQERSGAKKLDAGVREQPPSRDSKNECPEGEKPDLCIQRQAAKSAADQAHFAEVQARYTRDGLWLLFFTLLATAWAARGAARAAKVADRALVELERPQLVVEVVSSGLSVTGAALAFSGQFKYQFANYGRTVAKIVDINLSYPVQPGTAMPAPLSETDTAGMRTLPEGVVAAPGGAYDETENLFAIYGGVLLSGTALRNNRLFFMGYVRHRDIFDAVYVTGFCFVFDPIGQRFVRWGDAPYNYVKQER